MDEYDSGNPSEEVKELVSQAVSVRYALENMIHTKARDPADTSVPNTACFDSQGVNIQNGRAAVLDKDYVIKEQTIVEEEKQLEVRLGDVVVEGPYRQIDLGDSDTVYTCNNPRTEPTGLIDFSVEGSVPPRSVRRDRQIANLKYVNDKVGEEVKKRHSKTEDVDLDDQYRVVNCPDPEEDHHAVNKHYCDENSGKDTDGDGNSIWSFLGGILGGAASGIVSSLAAAGIT